MADPGRPYRHQTSARTSVGQIRENNEDSIRLWAHDAFVLGVVADGMGGAAAGEEASRLAVQAIERRVPLPGRADESSIAALTDTGLAQVLEAAIREGNRDILDLSRRSSDLRGMGTTVTAAYVRGSRCVIAHVGDSRAYLVSQHPPRIVQVTSDHSFVEALVSAGHLTPEQAAEHPMKNVLYRALGQADYVDVDVYEVKLDAGDCVVLCSDGLTRHVTPDEIAGIAHEFDQPDEISTRLIDMANARGGEDNVSVVVIQAAVDPAKDVEATLELRPISPPAEETMSLKKNTLLDDLISPLPASGAEDNVQTSEYPQDDPASADPPTSR